MLSCSFLAAWGNDLEAQFTIEPIFGTYFNPGSAFFVTQTENAIIAMTGTLNGQPVTLLPSYDGTSGWFGLDLILYNLDFSAGGQQYAIFPDNAQTLFGPGVDGFIDLTVDSITTTTPEPTSFVLLAVGLSGLAWRRLRS